MKRIKIEAVIAFSKVFYEATKGKLEGINSWQDVYAVLLFILIRGGIRVEVRYDWDVSNML